MVYDLNNRSEVIFKLVGKIDSTNADEIYESVKKIIDGLKNKNYDIKEIAFDAEKLEYLSSAGLRILLSIKKEYDNVSVVNANSDVYDVFKMTGFTELMNVEKMLRTVSIEECKLINKGGHGAVYKLDDETIIKVFNENASLEDVKREKENAKLAFKNGVPTAISFDIVKVNNSYGAVFELVNAKTLSELIEENPNNIKDYAIKFSNLVKTLQHTKVSNDLPSAKKLLIKRIEKIKEYLNDDEFEKVMNLAKAFPEGDVLTHGDLHTNNVMVSNDELILIDMAELTKAEKSFELINMYRDFVVVANIQSSEITSKNIIGIDENNSLLFWKCFISEYLGTDNSEVIEMFENKCKILSLLTIISSAGTDSKRGREKANLLMDHFVRGTIIPNYDYFLKVYSEGLNI